MTFAVRIWGSSGVRRLPVTQTLQRGEDSVYVRQQPFLWNQTITTAGAASVATAIAVTGTPDTTRAITVEVPDGNSIRYEVSTSATNVTSATSSSPLIQGTELVAFGAGWIFSFADAAAL